MIQFNLLPDVKLEYVKARRTMRMVSLVSVAVASGSVLILILMLLTVNVAQRKSLSDLNDDIATYSKQVKSVPDINKILTVQNQLNTLTSLHDQKKVTSRLFGYIAQITPNDTTISKLDIDFDANTASITGEAASLDIVNVFTDTLKNTNYVLGSETTGQDAFTQVVLSAFGRDSKGATYTITFNTAPAIFDSANKVKLDVPTGERGAQATLFQQEAN